jgi:heme exporter protein B
MMWRAYWAVVQRDVLLAWRRKSEGLSAVFFFVVVAALFPLGIGPELSVPAQYCARCSMGRRLAFFDACFATFV